MGKLVSSKHLEGVSDLTLSAPIKQGFIDAFEAVTYETRLRQIMKALFRIRSTSREYTKIKPFVDTAERIQSLLDFRLAIHGQELLLNATFDRPFEPYMRLIWDPLGPLLDVIFCNCEGYVTATEHGFEDYLAWVRRSQIDTDFFYAANGLTIEDVQYLVQVEKLQRSGTRFSAADIRIPNPMAAAKAIREEEETRQKSNELGIEALVAMHKLTDFYPPDRPGSDGKYLRWATQQLLDGWGRRDLGPLAMLVDEQLQWFEAAPLPQRKPACDERLRFEPENIQGGILEDHLGRRGALLLFRIKDAAKARTFLAQLAERIAKDKEQAAAAANHSAPAAFARNGDAAGAQLEDPFVNLAFTRHGLVNIGLPSAEVGRFPQEFREGMEDRAGLLGDIREDHPRRWTLPPRNARSKLASSGAALPPVGLAEVDIVIQLRTSDDRDPGLFPGAGSGPIDRRVRELRDDPDSGLELLSIETMRRAPARKDASSGKDIENPEHFGFADGISQPKIAAQPGACAKDETPLGEIFLGYCNSRTDSPPPANPILDNGTFLVVRKLSQDVAALESFIEAETERLKLEESTLTEDDLYANLLGRYRDGTLVCDPDRPNPRFNEFTYEDDVAKGCPFHAHIRRTHPRVDPEKAHGRPGPRILRRGMSYGPAPGEPQDAPRGIFFMAYNASIAEQFEVIQRWMAGGNSTGIASWQNDPLMAAASSDEPRFYQFVHKGKTLTTRIERSFVTLQWGAYLFVPSISGIKAIAALAADERAASQTDEIEKARRGKEIIDRLRTLAESGPGGRAAAAAGWKTCLEDFSAKDPAEKDQAMAVWAAIRLHHGGAIRVPYGMVGPGEEPREAVLVGSKELVMRVFRDPHDNYSMSGQMARMQQSFGEIYLGMDKGPKYKAKSAINAHIAAISAEAAFETAYKAATAQIVRTFALGRELNVTEYKMDLRRHLITPALATICNRWFGIPDELPPGSPNPDRENFVDPWGWSWEPADARKPRCPGDYMATSRFCFYPDPIPKVRAYGQAQGQALRKTVREYFDKMRKPGQERPTGILAPPPESSDPPPVGFLSAVMANLQGPTLQLVYPDNDELARNVIGVMTGFLPPADGCMRWAFYDWIEEETLPRVQHDLLTHESDSAFVRADKALRPWLERAIQKRPAPDLLWRTAKHDHRLGTVDVAADDKIIVGIVSALAEDEAAGITDIYPVFGGDRAESGAPLHACPAYKAAMGTMLGIVAALLENARIEPLPATLLVKVSEPNPRLAPLIEAAREKIRPMVGKMAEAARQARDPTPPSPPPPPGGNPLPPPAATGEARGMGQTDDGHEDGPATESRHDNANEKADEPAD